jgi:hypothetical protein
VMKNWKPDIVKNNILEKSLHSVVNKWYTLSIWRLYHVIEWIRSKEVSWRYTQLFFNYLEEYKYIENILLNGEVFQNFSELIESHVLWQKRHTGKIDFPQTRDVRKLLIWDFQYKNCLIYSLLEIGKSDF